MSPAAHPVAAPYPQELLGDHDRAASMPLIVVDETVEFLELKKDGIEGTP